MLHDEFLLKLPNYFIDPFRRRHSSPFEIGKIYFRRSSDAISTKFSDVIATKIGDLAISSPNLNSYSVKRREKTGDNSDKRWKYRAVLFPDEMEYF